ncbi:PREDICTED: WD repeat-containing protein 66-like isoform X2 [Papilio polytes]|uniref:WD repeat-containing protein 66-like isoform X2 n=1 Tax=Papilio polytes TaxID=76194 RepID=UPI000676810D|nr:PREDICTED: WD repeat-containing protein 66-like isoform X2 [Papilio polytes]
MTSHPSGSSRAASDIDVRRLYSLSLSQIRKHSELGNYHYKPAPFNIRWIHGYNAKVGVINLNDEGSTIALYAAGNCAVLYNWTTNEMRILQGHKHVVTCIAADSKGKWLVTADSGPENVLIVWDSSDNFPVKTLFSPHGGTNIAKITLSPDAKYLLTIGYREKAVVYWWIWSFGNDEPHATLELTMPRGAILDMAFNPIHTEQFVLMTKHDIWIGVSRKVFVTERGVVKDTNTYELVILTVERKQNSEFGKLTCFTHVRETCQILAGTNRGYALVYGYTSEFNATIQDAKDIEDMKFVKGLKIQQCRIEVIKNIDGVIATGNSEGAIHFYDPQLKLLYWVHGFTVDKVTGLSFNVSPRSYQIFDPKCNKQCLCWEKVVLKMDPVTGVRQQKLMKSKLPSDATVPNKPFVVRDFIVCTKNQGVGFVDFVAENNHTILDNKTSPALAMTVHPEKPYVCVGYADGTLELYNFVRHMLFARLPLRERYKVVTEPADDSISCLVDVFYPQLSVTCLKYSPNGLHLACGLNTGQLIFLDPTTIEIRSDKPFQDTRFSIKEISFSLDSRSLAFFDAGRTVCLYKYDCASLSWQFIAKHRAHYKDVTAVFFLPEKNESGDYKLMSMGADRTLVEYDIGASSEEYLEILSLDRIEQSAIPLAGIPWPSPKDIDPETCRTDMPMILIANDEFKYKIINYKTTMTLATVLGPRFEHPVRRLQLVTRTDDDEGAQYLLFATKTVVGLQKMPLDGNPWRHIGLLGHPIELIEVCYREDVGILFTIGAKDSCMTQWAANYRAIDTTTKQGGTDLDPYYCLIENGRPGWLFHEIRDLFYYIQILCQGTFSPSIRTVKDFIPIETLPDMMRALGFFPSEYEVENLIVEAKYKVYQRQPSTEIDFEEFVKLYLNHRPAFLESARYIKNAFKHFANPIDGAYVMSRNQFINMLSDYGERFPRELSSYLLSILCCHSFEDRCAMYESDFHFLPETINLSELLCNIIGVSDYDNLSESYYKGSGSSMRSASTDSDNYSPV